MANFLNMVKRPNGGARAYAERVGLKINWGNLAFGLPTMPSMSPAETLQRAPRRSKLVRLGVFCLTAELWIGEPLLSNVIRTTTKKMRELYFWGAHSPRRIPACNFWVAPESLVRRTHLQRWITVAGVTRCANCPK